MKSRLDLEELVYNEELNYNVRTFPEQSDLDSIRNNYTIGEVKKGMGYRPDKLAEYYLGSSKLAWMIMVCNNFTNGIRDIREGEKIKIPTIS